MSQVKPNKKIQPRARPSPRCSVVSSSAPISRRGAVYRFVYRTFSGLAISFLLITSFAFQGVSVVFAQEFTPPTVQAQAEIIEPIENSPATEVGNHPNQTEENNVADSQINLEQTTEEIVQTTTSLEDASNEVSTTSIPAYSNSDTTEEENIDNNVGTGLTAEEGVATTTEGQATSTDNSGDTGLPEDNSATTTVEDSVVPSEDLIGPIRSEAISTNQSDTGFMFTEEQCIRLASGSFYCHKTVSTGLEDALFAAPDEDGDLEIFLVREGVQRQITTNLADDAAPVFDKVSNSIVWHRMINDRYQIISFDLTTGEEEQLTSDATNNMEPSRQGSYTVWQRWVDSNWEVILHDGKSEQQISANQAHDIAPHIHGSLLVWNRLDTGGKRTIEMYDIRSKTYVTVDDPSGLSVANPRMVIIYDQLHPNGDVVTLGYDLLAERFIQLDTLPRQLPEQIPESEPTSETRALIQNKPTIKGDDVVSGDVKLSEPPPPDDENDPLTLDLTKPLSNNETKPSGLEMNDYDLIIEPITDPTISVESGVKATST